MSKARLVVNSHGAFEIRLRWKKIDYYLTWYERKGTPFPNRAFAESKRAEINADLRNSLKEGSGYEFDPSYWFSNDAGKQLKNWGPKWFELEKTELRPQSREIYERELERLIAFPGFGDMLMKDFQSHHLTKYVNKSPNPPNSWSFIRHFFDRAVENNIIQRRPGMLKRPKPKTRRIKTFFSRAEQDQVLEKVPEYDRPIFDFMRNHGIRVGEAIGLQWENIDWAGQQVFFYATMTDLGLQAYRKGKPGLIHTFLFNDAEILRPLRQISGFVFVPTVKSSPTPRGSEYYDRRYLSRILREACKEAGFEQAGPHNFCRRSFATMLYREGFSLPEIKSLMGHANITTTMRYIEEDSTNVCEKVKERLNGKVGVSGFQVQ